MRAMSRCARVLRAVAFACSSCARLRREVRLLSAHLRAVDERVDLGEQIALLDDRVVVDEDLRHPPVDLRADVDFEERLHRARGLHALEHVADRHGGGREPRRRQRPVLRRPGQAAPDHEDDAQGDGEPAHPAPSPLFRGQCLLQFFSGGDGVGHGASSAGRSHGSGRAFVRSPLIEGGRSGHLPGDFEA